jgi:SAM-dependent methyltransferase
MPAFLQRVLDRLRWEWREWHRPSAPSFLQEELDHALLDLVGWRPGERVLDVGCAGGQYLRAFAARGLIPTGIDIDLSALRQGHVQGPPSPLHRRAHPPSPTVLAASARDLPFGDRSFDAVVCHKTMHLFPQPRRAAAEFARVLRPGGRVVFSTSNRASPYARVAAAAIRRGRYPNWTSANDWSAADWCGAFAALGLKKTAVYSCNLVWPLVFRVCDRWIIPNEWMRRYTRWIRRVTRQPFADDRPHGAALDYVLVLTAPPRST